MPNHLGLYSLAALWLILGGALSALAAQEPTSASPEVITDFSADMGAGRLKVLTSQAPAAFTQEAFLTFAETTINVPVEPPGSAWGSGRLVARFSGESFCSGSSGWCSLRILVDGVELEPTLRREFAFDSATPVASPWESNAVERTSFELAPGQHTVTLQARLVRGATRFELDDWALVLTLWRVS